MKQKRLTDNQSELVAAFLPQKLQKNRKLSASVKLVLANIYQLYYYENNKGKRTVFRTREDFINDIEANDKNEVLRPHAVLMQNDMVFIKSGVRGKATEYTLNDELYALLPKQIRGEVSDKFTETLKCKNLKDSELQIEENDDISPLYNELNHNEISDSFVPSDSDTETEIETDEIIHESILHETEQSLADEYDEIFNEVDYDEVERVQAAYLQGPNPSSVSFKERNEWATRCYEELEANIQVLFKCWDADMILNYSEKINSIFDKVDERINQGWFTKKQIAKFDAFINNFNSIIRKKAELVGNQESSSSETIQSPGSNENNITSIESKNNMVEPPVLEYSGREYHFNDNVISYMDVLFMTQYMGHRRIDDWYKDDIDTLKVAINNLEDVRYRDYYNEFLRAEGF